MVVRLRHQKRALRVRYRLKCRSAGRLRLSVFRSDCQISAQIIDDKRSCTLVSVSSLEKKLRDKKLNGIQMASEVGRMLAERASEKDVSVVVFDRGPYPYHGRIKALAEAAREKGLEF